jgi:hypothetical protein
MRVMKKGKVVDIPVKRGTVVKLRELRSGKVTNERGIVMGSLKPSAFSRAYGRQVFVCTISGRKQRSYDILERGAGDLFPVGRVKKMPKACLVALKEEKAMYPSLAAPKRARRR